MSPAEASIHHADELRYRSSTKAAAEKEDFSGLYNFRQNNNNASNSSTDTTRHRGGASAAKSREMQQPTTKSTKRQFAQMSSTSSTSRAEPIPPLDVFILRLSEKAPSVMDTTLRNGLQKIGQFLPAFEYCYRSGDTISESDFLSTYAVEVCGGDDATNSEW
jgi:Tfp pilus assembly protein PilW